MTGLQLDLKLKVTLRTISSVLEGLPPVWLVSPPTNSWLGCSRPFPGKLPMQSIELGYLVKLGD